MKAVNQMLGNTSPNPEHLIPLGRERHFSGAIVKLTAFCNLNCSYCYMFNLSDKTYQSVPKNMSAFVALRTIQEIRRYMTGTGQSTFDLTLHGGEPSLWPMESYRALLGAVRDAEAEEGVSIRLSMQTNALLPLPHALLDLFRENDVVVGISLDGPRQVHDRYRFDHSGRGSYDRVLTSVQHMVECGYGDVLGGFLMVMHPELEASELLDWLDSLPISRLDLIWPMEFTQDDPPWRREGLSAYRQRPRYGTWLSDLFREWARRDDPSTEIRLFTETLVLKLAGRGPHTDDLVNDSLASFVVNTDGRVEYPDYLRVAGTGNSRTEFTVLKDDLRSVSRDPIFEQLLTLSQSLPVECTACPHVGACGGGFLPGRMSTETKLSSRRSVMCYDQFHFFTVVENALREGLEWAIR